MEEERLSISDCSTALSLVSVTGGPPHCEAGGECSGVVLVGGKRREERGGAHSKHQDQGDSTIQSTRLFLDSKVTLSQKALSLSPRLPADVISVVAKFLMLHFLRSKTPSPGTRKWMRTFYAILHINSHSRQVLHTDAKLMSRAIKRVQEAKMSPIHTSLYGYLFVFLSQSPNTAVRELIFLHKSPHTTIPLSLSYCKHITASHVLSLLQCQGSVRLNVIGCENFSLPALVEDMKAMDFQSSQDTTTESLYFRNNSTDTTGLKAALSYIGDTLKPTMMFPLVCRCSPNRATTICSCADCGKRHELPCATEGCSGELSVCDGSSGFDDYRDCPENMFCSLCGGLFCRACVSNFFICPKCFVQECPNSSLHCSVCNVRFCIECGDGGYCERCFTHYCSSCNPVDTCNTCEVSFCIDCLCVCAE